MAWRSVCAHALAHVPRACSSFLSSFQHLHVRYTTEFEGWTDSLCVSLLTCLVFSAVSGRTRRRGRVFDCAALSRRRFPPLIKHLLSILLVLQTLLLPGRRLYNIIYSALEVEEVVKQRMLNEIINLPNKVLKSF